MIGGAGCTIDHEGQTRVAFLWNFPTAFFERQRAAERAQPRRCHRHTRPPLYKLLLRLRGSRNLQFSGLPPFNRFLRKPKFLDTAAR